MGLYNPNREMLARALESAQGLFDEYMIVDDGSNPQLDDEADIIHAKNEGFFAAKNTAIEHSTGDIICTLDWDDYFDRGGVERLKDLINQYPEGDIWHFQLEMFGEGSGLYGAGANPNDLTSFNSIPGISWYRRKVWEELGGFKAVQAEDWNFWLRAFKAGYKFSYYPGVVYHFNKRSDSVSAGWTGAKFDEIRKEVFDNV